LMGRPMRAISDRPIRHGGLTATSSGLRAGGGSSSSHFSVGQELADIDDLAHLLVIGLRGAMRVDQDGHPPQRVGDLDETTDLVDSKRRELPALLLSTEPLVGRIALGPDLSVAVARAP